MKKLIKIKKLKIFLKNKILQKINLKLKKIFLKLNFLITFLVKNTKNININNVTKLKLNFFKNLILKENLKLKSLNLIKKLNFNFKFLFSLIFKNNIISPYIFQPFKFKKKILKKFNLIQLLKNKYSLNYYNFKKFDKFYFKKKKIKNSKY